MGVRHHPVLAHRALPEFLVCLCNIDYVTSIALKFTILNASKTGEALGGLRSEVDADLDYYSRSHEGSKRASSTDY